MNTSLFILVFLNNMKDSNYGSPSITILIKLLSNEVTFDKFMYLIYWHPKTNALTSASSTNFFVLVNENFLNFFNFKVLNNFAKST
jgi:hypothetical protein